jgi:prepilin-type N-terminal cleavage/methylation domain-containing protein
VLSTKQSGFSLVELIVTILLIAILASVALPRFLNTSDDAKHNTIEQLFTQVQSTVNLNFGLAQVKKLTKGEQEVTVELGPFSFHSGYPQNKSEASSPNKFFFDLLNLSGGTLVVESQDDDSRTLIYGKLRIYEDDQVSRIGYGDDDLSNSLCVVEYSLSETGTMTITKTISGC